MKSQVCRVLVKENLTNYHTFYLIIPKEFLQFKFHRFHKIFSTKKCLVTEFLKENFKTISIETEIK